MLDVLKREVTEGDKAQEAARKIARAAGRALRARQTTAADTAETDQTPVGQTEDAWRSWPTYRSPSTRRHSRNGSDRSWCARSCEG